MLQIEFRRNSKFCYKIGGLIARVILNEVSTNTLYEKKVMKLNNKEFVTYSVKEPNGFNIGTDSIQPFEFFMLPDDYIKIIQ